MAGTITLGGATFDANEGESVLDTLERNGVPMLSSCRSGVCQSCLMQAVDGTIPDRARQGLKESLRAQGYFLSCVCMADGALAVAMPGEGLDYEAAVLESHDLGAAVRRIRFSIPNGFEWFAGQYVTIIRGDGVARSYSIASSPADSFIELHVRRIAGGALSNWFHDVLAPGDSIRLRGPFGECFYTPGDAEAPLLMAGTGTGLAPLYGILRDAMRHSHSGPIRLIHGALSKEGLYHREELRAIARDHGIDYKACVLKGEGGMEPDTIMGSLDEVVLAQPLDLKRARAYLCGDPGLVESMRKKLFMKGLSNRRIFADKFVASVVKKD